MERTIADLIATGASLAENASPADIDRMIEALRQKGIERPEWRPLLFPIMARLGAEQSLRNATA